MRTLHPNELALAYAEKKHQKMDCGLFFGEGADDIFGDMDVI